jgi:hypothetical protein
MAYTAFGGRTPICKLSEAQFSTNCRSDSDHTNRSGSQAYRIAALVILCSYFYGLPASAFTQNAGQATRQTQNIPDLRPQNSNSQSQIPPSRSFDSNAKADETVLLAAGGDLFRQVAGLAVVGLLVVAAGFSVFSSLRGQRVTQARIDQLETIVQVERRRVSELGRAAESNASVTGWGKEASPPELPDELLAAVRQRDLVPVLGPGASAQAGLPTRHSLWLNILDQFTSQVPEKQLEDLRSVIAREGVNAAIEPTLSLLGRDRILVALGHELAGSGARPSRFHQLIAQLPVPAILDTNWDDLISRALAGRGAVIFGSKRHDGISEALRAGQLVVVKPLGDIRQPESVLLTELEYRRELSQAPELERSIGALFSTRTLLFLGFSLRGLERFLR